MPQIDRLFQSMCQRGADRAILLSDQPMQLVVGQQMVEGALLPNTMLQSMLAEVVPADKQAQMSQGGEFEFFHPVPQGTMRFNILRQGNILRAVIDLVPAEYPSNKWPPFQQPLRV